MREDRWESLPVMRAGQRMDFYPPGEEARLAKIEQSALGPLNRLRNRSKLDLGGRGAVGKYLVAMIARTERARLRMADYLSSDIASAKGNPELTAKRWNGPEASMLDYLRKIEEGLEGDPLRTTQPLLHQVLEFPGVQAHVLQMHWEIFTAASPEQFLTSDSPVFVGGDTGLKPPRGEFRFALASDVALVGSWQGRRGGLQFLKGSPGLIREFNRYVISGADRWLYFHEKADWVPKVVMNPSTRIGRRPW